MEARRSLYDVLRDNLVAAGRRTFLHRLIYIGRHTFEEEQAVTLLFETTIKTINDGYCDEPLTGLFLWYNEYFVNCLEGSEETLNRHLQLLLEQVDSGAIPVTVMRVIRLSFHIKKRYFQQWIARPVHAHTLPERISPDSDMEKTGQLLQTCIGKLYQLAELLQKQTASGLQLILDHLSERVPHLLPEPELMEFILSVSWLHDPRHVHSYFAALPHIDVETDLEFPETTDFVPYNVFFTLPEPED